MKYFAGICNQTLQIDFDSSSPGKWWMFPRSGGGPQIIETAPGMIWHYGNAHEDETGIPSPSNTVSSSHRLWGAIRSMLPPLPFPSPHPPPVFCVSSLEELESTEFFSHSRTTAIVEPPQRQIAWGTNLGCNVGKDFFPSRICVG